MSCSTGDAYKAVRDKPSLGLASISNPLGALAFVFLLVTSVEGLRSFTESDSVLELLKKSLTSVLSVFKALGKKNLNESRDAVKFDGKSAIIFSFTLLLSASLLIAFASDKTSWLTAIVGILIGFIFLSVLSRSLRASWVKAVNGGAIVGASIALFYWLIKQIDTWSTKYVFTDIVFFSLFVYIVLAGLALWNIYVYQPIAGLGSFVNV